MSENRTQSTHKKRQNINKTKRHKMNQAMDWKDNLKFVLSSHDRTNRNGKGNKSEHCN